MKKSFILSLSVVSLLMVGCTQPKNHNPVNTVRKIPSYQGEIIDKKFIEVESINSGTGAKTGVVTGGIAGVAMGKGNGKIATTVAGAVAGGVVGSMALVLQKTERRH